MRRLILCFAVVLTGTLSVCRAAAAPDADKTRLQWRDQQASVVARPAVGELRLYDFTAGADSAEPPIRQVAEAADRPYLRTGNIMFDGLFAMAIADARLAGVSQIRDAAFNNGEAIACECYETGEKWRYVWTRDISYATDLGLGYLDPHRALNSLLFKTSGVRPELLGDHIKPVTVVAQDTGSGGSWPVSTDRVVWILAATDVLDQLPQAERTALARRIFDIARDTLEQDHRFAFDALVGLYRGETSFLDWREQTYPNWTQNDVLYIAGGYAFSTNVLHVIALERTATLAAQLQDPAAARYRQWARQLRRAINARFWQENTGLYASYLGPMPGVTPAAAYDLLGLSLAIVHGVADSRQARLILEHYPMTEAGPPVIFPQQPGVAIYHNRALWPFVTAYALQAAKVAANARFAAESARSLIRGAALSLSNMENFEFLTQQTRFEDGELSGPVINSPRQIWSVAGYLNMVLESLWGLHPGAERLTVNPAIPADLGAELFAGQRELSLHRLTFAGFAVNVTLILPESWPASGWLEADGVSVNGNKMPGTEIPRARFKANQVNEIRVRLRPAAARVLDSNELAFHDSRQLTPEQSAQVFAPRSPWLLSAVNEKSVTDLVWQSPPANEAIQIFRNGEKIADQAGGTNYQDELPATAGTTCYSLTARNVTSGLTSLPSREICVAPAGLRTIVNATAMHSSPDDQTAAANGNAADQFPDWGTPEQALQFKYSPPASGRQRMRLRYANAHGPINTGITAAVKTVTAQCGTGGPLQSGTVVMPHLAAANAWDLSTGFFFDARRGESCTLRIADGFNMSYLRHFELYTGGQGGKSGPMNRASIAAAELEVFRD